MFNYSSSYTNNLVAVPHEISSWKTLDLNLGYSFKGEGFLDGLSVGLAIENALDKEPPFVDRSEGFDPQVSSAIGRLVSLSVRKRW
jgi:iron complex outermembrane receptor protein